MLRQFNIKYPFLLFLLLLSLCVGCCAMNKKRIVLLDNRSIIEQLTQTDAVYIFKHAFDLRGQVVIIPEDCVLRFKKGGRLCNAVVVGNNTIIDAPRRIIFENVDIDLTGSWASPVGYPEWFGALNDPDVDSKIAIQKAIDVSNTCILSQDYYTSYDTQTGRGDDVKVCAIAVNNKAIRARKRSHVLVDAKHSNTERTSVFWVGDNVMIDGISIRYINVDFSGWTGTQAGVYRVQGKNVTIQNTSLYGAMSAWINLLGAPGRDCYVFRNNFIHDCDCGLIIQGIQHTPNELYSMKLIMENNVIEKEGMPYSEFVSFWGACQGEGKVYYTDITIKNNRFSGGIYGGCITGHPQYNGLKDVVITDNFFDDCGACSFYNADGLVYERNYVTSSSFVERQVKGVMGSYPDLRLINCCDCTIDKCSCFGLTVINSKQIHIGELRQTLGLKKDDPFLTQKDYVTNFIGINADNSSITIDKLVVNPFEDDHVVYNGSRYYVHRGENSDVIIDKLISNIPFQDSDKRLVIRELMVK